MNTNISRWTACALLAGLALLCTISALAQEELFTYRQVWSSMPLDTGPATVAEYEIAFNVSALARSERNVIELELPDGGRFVAVPEEIEHRDGNSLAWRGRLKGEGGEGHGVITVHRGYIAGRLLFPGRDVIELKPGPEPGVVRLLELDSSLFPECGVDASLSTELLKSESLPESPPFSTVPRIPELLSDSQHWPVIPASTQGGNPIIDVMVVYTPMARQQAGGTAQIEVTIQAAIDITNNAYDNSEVFQRLDLVYVQEVPYGGDQTGASYSQQLSWVRNDSSVAALRNQHHADVVALISGQTPGVCGVAYGMYNPPGPVYESSAFSVTLRSCAVGILTFAHELGHNMGLNHDPNHGPSPENASFPWSFGHFFQVPNGTWRRTIMAYSNSCPGSCPKIPYFSNPNVLYEGVPIGIAGQRDNARTLNLTANMVAQYRNAGNGLFSTRFGAINAAGSLDCITSDWHLNVGIDSADAGVQGSENRRYGGPCGLRVGVTNSAYVRSNHPDNEGIYNVRFYAFLDDATGNIKLFDARNASNQEAFSVWFLNGNVTLRVATSTGQKSATFSNIESGWHSIHVNWKSASNANVEFLVANRNTPNGAEKTISGNTSAYTIDSARLGSVDGTQGSGALHFDDFVSTRNVVPGRLLRGDADGDGVHSGGDITVINQERLGIAFAKGQPDCDEDGSISGGDVTCVNLIRLGEIDP